MTTIVPAREALERLREGNCRFVAGQTGRYSPAIRTRRAELVADQRPFAVILGCSDSRVPPELVFDQGLGDLFVVRVAGNVAGASQVESVEFAVDQLGARLVVVLGHSGCAAVLATLEDIARPGMRRPAGLRSIVDRIRPSAEALQRTVATDGPGLVTGAVRANVRASGDSLRSGSEVVAGLVAQDALLVVGAEYSLETGMVDFFDGVPETG